MWLVVIIAIIEVFYWFYWFPRNYESIKESKDWETFKTVYKDHIFPMMEKGYL